MLEDNKFYGTKISQSNGYLIFFALLKKDLFAWPVNELWTKDTNADFSFSL